ncbi:MAG TPA: biotin--[acetyl-CoA-carboxylase] ligase [Sporichthya sp.]|nr:biotin--[acetyl-CoA-carboxylase] ligase [Sporichthya sp.]
MSSPLASPVDEALLRAALPPGPWELVVVAETGSTNADVRAAALAGQAGPGYVVLAEHQTSGRGRLDRTWTAAPGEALTFSVLVRPERVPSERWAWLPLLAGVAVVDAVRGLRLKWPNDVLDAAGGKVAGILVERIDAPSGPMAVIGIGLNVTGAPPIPGASSLARAGGDDLNRTTLLAVMLGALAARFEAWHGAAGDAEASGLAAAYRAACATLGSEVRVDLPGGEVLTGPAEDIDADGALVVVAATGRQRVAAGDVRHVRAAG